MKLFVFDMDGVILNSMPTLTRLATGLISREYHEPFPKAKLLYEGTAGYPFVKQLELIFGVEIFEGRNKNFDVANIYEECHMALAPVFPLSPMAEMVIDTVRELGIKTALVSSTERRILEQTAAFMLPFDFIGGLFPPNHSKRIQIQYFTKLSNVGPDEKVFFGDTESDKRLASDLGFQFYKVKTPEHFAMTVGVALSRLK